MARRKRTGWSFSVGVAVVLALSLMQLFGPAQRTRPEAEPADRTTAAPPTAPAPPSPSKLAPPRSTRAAGSLFAADSPWASPEACEASLRAHPPRRANDRARIGTWNLAWFPDGTASNPTPERAHDVPWLACIIAVLNVDVLAVQEMVQHLRGRAALLDLLKALDARTGGRHEAVLDECKDDGRQHVGFVYDRTRVQAEQVEMLRELNPGRSACDYRLRPGFAARFSWRHGGLDLRAVTLHLDSGVLDRDYSHRKTSVERLRALLPALAKAPQGTSDDVVVLGDWNTMGCERCLPAVPAAEEVAALDATLDALVRVSAAPACSHYYRGHGGLLDHVLVTRGTRELPKTARVEAHGVCAALSCERLPSRADVTAFARLSDHCPLVLELDARDLD